MLWVGPGQAERWGTVLKSVLSGCGRIRSPGRCLGEADGGQTQVPGAGGVRGAPRHASQKAGKEAGIQSCVLGGAGLREVSLGCVISLREVC